MLLRVTNSLLLFMFLRLANDPTFAIYDIQIDHLKLPTHDYEFFALPLGELYVDGNGDPKGSAKKPEGGLIFDLVDTTFVSE